MVGRLLSFWDDIFSGAAAMLNFHGVFFWVFCPHKCVISSHPPIKIFKWNPPNHSYQISLYANVNILIKITPTYSFFLSLEPLCLGNNSEYVSFFGFSWEPAAHPKPRKTRLPHLVNLEVNSGALLWSVPQAVNLPGQSGPRAGRYNLGRVCPGMSGTMNQRFAKVIYWGPLEAKSKKTVEPECYFTRTNASNHINRILLLMAEILHKLIGSLSHYLQEFIHPRWCRISSINSMGAL